MNITDKQELHEYRMDLAKEGLKGFAGGAVLSGAWFYFWRMHPPNYNQYTYGPRALMFMVPMIAGGLTMLEVGVARKERQALRDGNLQSVSKQKIANQMPSKTNKDFNFLWQHRHKILVGGWAGSLATAYWWIDKNKYMTKSQKIVQARMSAQAITIAMLLASLAVSERAGTPSLDKERATMDPGTWKKAMDTEIKKLEEQNAPLVAEAPKHPVNQSTTHRGY